MGARQGQSPLVRLLHAAAGVCGGLAVLLSLRGFAWRPAVDSSSTGLCRVCTPNKIG